MEIALPREESSQIASAHPIKKILFVTRVYEFGGAEKHLLDLIRRMREPGIQLSVLCIGADYCSERLDPRLNVRVIRRDEMPSSLRDWVKLFRDLRPDVAVLIYGSLGAFPWLASVGAWLAGVRRRYSIQHVVLSVEAKRSFLRRTVRRTFGPLKLRLAANLFSRTICVSNELATSLINNFGFPAKKMQTIHNGVSLSEYVPLLDEADKIRTRLDIASGEFLLVCTARLNQQKGLDILLQAMARVTRAGVPCRCVIVGDGPLKEQLFAQSHELGLSGHVFFEGFHEDVRPYLRAGSVFILTSRQEGLPLAILEAMASGLPCIVTNVGGNAEAVTDQVEGLVVPSGDVEAIAGAISYLASHPAARARMSTNARLRACNEFDIDRSMAKIESVIVG